MVPPRRPLAAERILRPLSFDCRGALSAYAKLLRRTNVVVPQPTGEDFAYLRRIHVTLDGINGDDFAKTSSGALENVHLNDAALSHIGRLYDLERLYADRGSTANQPITDAGLAHIRNLINLRRLSLEGVRSPTPA